MITRHFSFLAVAALCLSFVVGCAHDVSPNTYTADAAGVASKVVQGVILSKRKIAINTSQGVGGIAGAVAGAAGGSAIGGSSRANLVAGVGGAVLGGVIGDAVEKRINKREGFEYMIKTKDGSIISVAQDKDLNLAVNQKVMVIYGATVRIVPDETGE